MTSTPPSAPPVHPPRKSEKTPLSLLHAEKGYLHILILLWKSVSRVGVLPTPLELQHKYCERYYGRISWDPTQIQRRSSYWPLPIPTSTKQATNGALLKIDTTYVYHEKLLQFLHFTEKRNIRTLTKRKKEHTKNFISILRKLNLDLI